VARVDERRDGAVGRQCQNVDLKNYQPIPWRDSISRPIAPVSSVECGDDTTRPRRHGNDRIWNFTQLFNVMCTATAALKKIETILSELITQTMQ
jgi:hypothetical protein